jgi:hypothetical protein
LDAAKTMTPHQNSLEQRREQLNFLLWARERFVFLTDLGFSEIEATPTVLRFQKGEIEVDIYHGEKSFELGAGVSYMGTRYELIDMVRAQDIDAAKELGIWMTSTSDGIKVGVEKLATMMQQFGRAALDGNPNFFDSLALRRAIDVDEYWMEILARQIRPRADDAFRRGDYAEVVELFMRIESHLTKVEKQKLALARARST